MANFKKRLCLSRQKRCLKYYRNVLQKIWTDTKILNGRSCA